MPSPFNTIQVPALYKDNMISKVKRKYQIKSYTKNFSENIADS